MITQAIKRWLEKLFGWFSGKPASENEYTPVVSPLNKSVTQESVGRSATDGVAPQYGVAPRIVGQGETSCSTIDEWPERATQPPVSPPVPPGPVEKIELPPAPPQIPVTPPIETTITALDTSPGQGEASFPIAPPPNPTAEQKLEFLHYLVKRGIVNEGFAEGQVPEQYKK